jgi:hypothetical protein
MDFILATCGPDQAVGETSYKYTLTRLNAFVYDGIIITPDLGDDREWAKHVMLLVKHILSCPLPRDETILWEDFLSFAKLTEDGFLIEQTLILGWNIDLQR